VNCPKIAVNSERPFIKSIPPDIKIANNLLIFPRYTTQLSTNWDPINKFEIITQNCPRGAARRREALISKTIKEKKRYTILRLNL